MPEGAFEVVMFDLVEAIHVELPHETVNFVVAEVVWQHYLLELGNILYNEL